MKRIARIFVILALLTGLVGSLFVVSPAAALTVTAAEADAFQGVVEDGDILIVMRYQLPLAEWQTTDYLYDATCADSTDILDPCYTSLLDGVATQVMVDSGGTLIASRQLPRISWGMAANYLCAPGSDWCTGQTASTITFGDTTLQTCVRGPTSVVPQPESCTYIDWHTSTDNATMQQSMLTFLVPQVAQIERDTNQSFRTYVVGGQVTAAGSVFPTEAFSVLPLHAPLVFNLAASQIERGFAPPTPNPATGLPAGQTAAQSQAVWLALQGIGDMWGVDAWVMGFLIAVIIGAFLYLASIRLVPNRAQSAVGFGSAFIALLAAGELSWIPWSGIFAIAIALDLIGIAWFWRSNMPQG